MADAFRVFAYDLNTNTLISELPATNLTFDSRLNAAGAITFDLALKRDGVSALVADFLSYEGRPVALYVDRDGIIVWGGIGWTGNYVESTAMLAVGGREFRSYFAQRVAVADYSETTYPGGIDPGLLVYKIFTDAQNPVLAGAGSSIGLTVVNNTGGLMPDIIPGYPLYQYTFVDQIATDMAAVTAPGVGVIDVTVSSAWDPTTGLPVNTLTVWTPRAGATAGDSGLVFDLTNVIDFTWATDAQQSATNFIVTGSGNGQDMPVQQANAPGIPVGGLGQSPRLDRVESTTAQSQDQVSLMANGLAAQYGKPLATPTVTVPTAGTQPLGSWAMGDDARVYAPAGGVARFPNGIDEFWRIVQQEVTVPNEGVPFVKVTLNQPPIY